jgi:hypothetical protein
MRVVNLHDLKAPAAAAGLPVFDYARREGVAYVGRGSPLGNPFPLGPGVTREAVIASYRQWLWEKIRARDERVLAQLAELVLNPPKALGCWCSPQACHADVILKCLAWLKTSPALWQGYWASHRASRPARR